MTKGVKLAMICAAVIFAAAVIAALYLRRPAGETMVEIVQNGKRIATVDLSQEEDRVMRIESADGGWNEVKIGNGTICISDADCPDQTCVRTGVLHSEDIPIVCLPHKLIVRFCEEGD